MESGTNPRRPDPRFTLPGSGEPFRTAFAVAPIALAILAADGRIDMANAAFCELLGRSSDDLNGIRLSDLYVGEGDARSAGVDYVLPPGQERCSVEVWFNHDQQQPLRCVLSLALVRGKGGEAPYYVAQVRDITTERIAERRLAQYAGELERSNQELEQLATVVSHDLQAPLRTLRGYAQLLIDEYGRLLDEQGIRWTSYVMNGADRMQVLIGDLLKVARVQAHSSPVIETDLTPIVTRAWERIGLMYAAASPELASEPLPVVAVDEIQIEQVFQNLFDNAVKYRRQDAPPRVRLNVSRLRDEWQFAVSDNGIGLEMVHSRRIFEVFQRLHADHEYDGTGIGLAVCKKIIERHRGRIWVESSPGSGSTFYFTIPDADWGHFTRDAS